MIAAAGTQHRWQCDQAGRRGGHS
ncbi:MAG: hypothetical protein JNJ61_09120 [Anaerolineae bacterium]|nr:hypothetical protein [Anaerolineae bacterium]